MSLQFFYFTQEGMALPSMENIDFSPDRILILGDTEKILCFHFDGKGEKPESEKQKIIYFKRFDFKNSTV